MKLNELNEKDRELIQQAKEALDGNYDEQKHMVGAAVRCKDGSVFTGVNCRCIHGSCAEFIAVGAAATAGNKELDTIVAVQRKDGIDHIVPPCGNCRQMLFDYCPTVEVILNVNCGQDGRLSNGQPNDTFNAGQITNKQTVKAAISDLLPFAYVNIENRAD